MKLFIKETNFAQNKGSICMVNFWISYRILPKPYLAIESIFYWRVRSKLSACRIRRKSQYKVIVCMKLRIVIKYNEKLLFSSSSLFVIFIVVFYCNLQLMLSVCPFFHFHSYLRKIRQMTLYLQMFSPMLFFKLNVIFHTDFTCMHY